MELVAKVDTAVAVGDELTTLLDWINIELFSGFTIIVENTGGGSADDITDIQIDTSGDGGVTPSLDQHAATPAVPITSGNSAQATFTETSAYIRVRATCTTDEDTTAKLWLMADRSTARICTLADVKDRLGIETTDTEHDSVIARIILGAESIFDGYCDRKLIANAADVTEYYTASSIYLQLKRYPLISITSIKESYDYDFDSADALTENTGFRQVNAGKKGILYHVYTAWPDHVDGIQVIYRGGFTAAGQTPSEGETALPANIREAAIMQSSFVFKRRDDIGLASTGFEGGSINKFSAMNLLPIVKQTLDKYRKRQL